MWKEKSFFFLLSSHSFSLSLSFIWCCERHFAMSLTSPRTLNVSFSQLFFFTPPSQCMGVCVCGCFCSFHLASPVIVCHSNCFRCMFFYVYNVFFSRITMVLHGKMNTIVTITGIENTKKSKNRGKKSKGWKKYM